MDNSVTDGHFRFSSISLVSMHFECVTLLSFDIERYPSLNSDCGHLIVLLLSILLVCIYVLDGVYEYLCVYVCVCLFTSVFVSVYLRVYGDCIRIFFAFKTLPSP